MQPAMQVLEVTLKTRRVAVPRQPVDTRSGSFFQFEERHFKVLKTEVVEERCEPLLLLCLHYSAYAFQPLAHTTPALRLACVGLARIPLGLGPSLHRLRSGLRRLVHRLHSHYGLVRLPVPVHHRLRLFTFPMRTAYSTHGPTRDLPVSDAILLRVTCSPTPTG